MLFFRWLGCAELLWRYAWLSVGFVKILEASFLLDLCVFLDLRNRSPISAVIEFDSGVHLVDIFMNVESCGVLHIVFQLDYFWL